MFISSGKLWEEKDIGELLKCPLCAFLFMFLKKKYFLKFFLFKQKRFKQKQTLLVLIP